MTLDELSARVAELAETVAAQQAVIDRLCAAPVAPVHVEAPAVTVNLPIAQPPAVHVTQASAARIAHFDHKWENGKIVRSTPVYEGGGT